MRIPFSSLLTATLLVLAVGCGDATSPKHSNPATETYASSLGVNISSMTKVSDQLYYQDLVVGTGTAVTTGKKVSVTYTGWFPSGGQFDSNAGKTAFTFTVGAGQVIAGWDLGVPGMKAGGKRLLVIGSDLGYGPDGFLSIPGGQTLVFSVEVLTVQ